jgi:Fe-S cluster biogenesis protein NfuA
MFIQTEETPNPLTLKFIPGVEVLKSGTMTFNNIEESQKSPLANSLLKIEGVSGVFLGEDFISITKIEDQNWALLKPAILTEIMDHFVSEKPVVLEGIENGSSAKLDSEIAKQIKEIIDEKVRPAVAQDGGDIVFRGFDEDTGIVVLEMHGACSGCPSSTITLKSGIENMLKHYIPEVTSVESVNGY